MGKRSNRTLSLSPAAPGGTIARRRASFSTMLSRLKSTVLVLVTAVLLIGAIAAFAGCQAETHLTRVSDTQWRTLLPDGSEFTFTRSLNGQSSAKAPGATSQPTVATLDDYSGTASASGQQEPASLPAFTYGLAQRQYLFYGTAVLCVLGAAFAMWRGQRQLAIWLGVSALVLLCAQTFIDRYAPWVVLAIIIGAIAYAVSWYVQRKHENRETMKVALAQDDPEAGMAVMASSPVGRDAAKDLRRDRGKTTDGVQPVEIVANHPVPVSVEAAEVR